MSFQLTKSVAQLVVSDTGTALVPVNTSIPTISGTAQVGQTLTGTNGTWSQSPTSYSYQWNRTGSPIGGAIFLTYNPSAADIGSTLTLTVTATNAAGSSVPATSLPTSAVTGAAQNSSPYIVLLAA